MASLIPASSSTDVDGLFQNAKSEFLTNLTVDEQAQFSPCDSADRLLSDVQGLAKISKSRRALPFLKKIKGFSDHIDPYFKVIELVCQAHPEWACIAWGAFRLILQLASNFTTFFEKLSNLIERLTKSLPRYADFYRSVSSNHKSVSPRLSDSLVAVYVDLFKFFGAVARIFSRPDGKLKRTAFVVGDLLWRPFDVHFQDILDCMNHHQEVLREELQLAGMQLMISKAEEEERRAKYAQERAWRTAKLAEAIKEKLNAETQRFFRAQVVSWLAPPAFKHALEGAQDTREAGTADWLFHEAKFRSWVSGDFRQDAILWVCGNPGWGKTVMAASTIDELEARSSQSGVDQIACYYFFGQKGSLKSGSTRTSAYRSIATQIFQRFHHVEAIHDIYALANDGSKASASEHEVLELLQMVLSRLSDVYIILDGVDECADCAKLVSEVQLFCANPSVKVLLFSRPHVAPLRRVIKSDHIISLSRTVMNEDIRVFLRAQLAVLADKNRFPSSSNLLSIEDELLDRADGMFLWARLMICYLDSPALTKSQRVNTIFKTTPVGLDEMYDRILRQIQNMDGASQQLAASVFTWVCYAQRDLMAEECADAIFPTGEDNNETERREYIDHAVIVVCCGLVEKRPDGTLQFIHLTARDYILTSSAESSRLLVPPKWEACLRILDRCLSYLLFTVPMRPLSGELSRAASARELSIQQPLLKYASVHWAEHLWDCLRAFLDADTSASNQEMLTTTLSLLGRFLSHKLCLTVWVEAIYLYAAGSPLNCLQLVPNLLDKASQLGAKLDCSQVTRNISDFATEMQEIDHTWHDTLVQTPHEIWNDATSFNSSAFLAKNNGISTHKLAPCQEDHPSKSLDPMFCVSANNTDCTFIGKIAIWPSRQFYECWNNKPEEFVSDWHKAIDHEHISRGWLALYEVHSIKDVPQKTLSHMISLPSEEISLQLQFSLRLSVLRHWKLKFPLAISSDLSTISILRTIIKFNRKHPQKREEVEVLSTVPWRDHWERLRSFWRPEKPVVDFSYTYEWLFSPGSTFVVFRDCDLRKERGTFAILKLSSHSSRLDAAVIKKEEFYGDALCPCAIHPFEQKLLLLDRNHIRFMDMDNHEEYFIPCAKSSGTIKIEFSKCGAYYVLHRDLSLPEIHLLPKTAFTNVSSKRPGSEEPCVAKRLKQHEHIFDGALSRTIDSLDIMGSSSSMIGHRAETMAAISPSQDSGPRRLELVSRHLSSDKKSTHDLVCLPKDVNTRHLNATLAKADARGSAVRIILNSDNRSCYDSDEPTVSRNLPAVIDKHTALLQFRSGEGAVGWSTMGRIGATSERMGTDA